VEHDQDQADEFAGWVLRRYGASLDDAKGSLVMPPGPFSEPIPPAAEALAAIERGWRNSGGSFRH
jgi:hypothetical protein